jgi:hypothetical protein
MRFALRLGLLVTLVVLAMSACAGGGGGGGGGEEQAKAQKQAKARPLPLSVKDLRPGEYRSEEFKPPLSFHVGKGWESAPPEMPDYLYIIEKGGEAVRWISFANVQDVYKPGTYDVVEAPKDLVAWFQRHPYLQSAEPEPVTVGGVKGVQFDAVVEDLPQDYSGMCGSGCLDIYSLSSGQKILAFPEGKKRRVIVLEDVKGETVTIDFGSEASPDDFGEFSPEAQKVVDSVEWSGS